MLNDRYLKTVRIPFTVQNGELRFRHDPKRKLQLRERAIGELVLNADALTDPAWSQALQAKSHVLIAHKGDEALLQMKLDTGSWELKSELLDAEGQPWNGIGESYAPVVLEGPLYLILSGEKKARLSGCPCLLLTLPDDNGQPQQAISLNQAFTMLSQRYEPKRQAHTGNIFQVGRLWQRDEKQFEAMETLRSRYTSEHEIQRRQMVVTQKTLPEM